MGHKNSSLHTAASPVGAMEKAAVNRLRGILANADQYLMDEGHKDEARLFPGALGDRTRGRGSRYKLERRRLHLSLRKHAERC